MAPNQYPTGGMVFLHGQEWDKLRQQVEQGAFGGQRVARSSGNNGQEHFGQGNHTNIGNGFSIRAADRSYFNADALSNPSVGIPLIAHELGHFAAPDASEDAANKVRDIYMGRLQQQQRDQMMVGLTPRSMYIQPQQVPQMQALPPDNPFLAQK